MINSIHIILISIISLIITRLVKLIIDISKGKNQEKNIFKDGGMPSCHASLVFGLIAGIFFIEGLTSVFAVALIFGLIVIHDAMSIRRQVGYHAEFLNKGKKQFKENTGHKPIEILVGVLIGIIVAFIYSGLM
jgi:uncharacterized protein